MAGEVWRIDRGLRHISDYHMFDLLGPDARPGDGFPGGDRSQVGRRQVPEGPTEAPESGPDGREHDHVLRREGWHIYKDTTLAETGAKLALAASLALLVACSPEETPGIDRVRLEPVARLAAGMDTLFPDIPTGVARSADGRYFVATGDGFFPQLVQVFDPNGRWLRAIGRPGSGPGEYRRASDVLPKGDSLLILDGTARRLTTLNAALEVAHAEQMPTWFSSPRLMPDGSLIGAVTRRGGDSSVVVFERWSPGSASTVQWTEPGSCDRNCWQYTKAFNTDATNGVWAIDRLFRYRLHRYDSLGAVLRSWDLTADWYVPYDSVNMTSPQHPPAPYIVGTWIDSAGRIWITAIASDAEWHEGLGPQRRGEGGRMYYPTDDWGLTYDGVIEVRDTTDGALLAAGRFDQPVLMLVVGAPGLVGRFIDDADGWWRLEILRANLQN